MHAIALLLESLFCPAMVICTLAGIGIAALVHWFFPSAPIELKAAFVALGFFVGLLLSWGSGKHDHT